MRFNIIKKAIEEGLSLREAEHQILKAEEENLRSKDLNKFMQVLSITTI